MLFNKSDIKEISAEDEKKASAVRLELRHKYSLAAVNAVISEAIGTPKMGEQIHFWTGARWSMHNLVHYLIDFTGAVDLIICTYTISEDALRLLNLMKQSGRIKSIKCLVDKRFSVRSAKALQLGKYIFDEYTLIDSHAKVTILKNDEWQITIVGSANYSENKRFECGIISCSNEATKFWENNVLNGIKDEKAYRRGIK